jgi:hypothetical protein
MKVGDLVLCIKQGVWVSSTTLTPITSPNPRCGQMLTIISIADDGNLIFEGFKHRYKADRFILVTPPADMKHIIITKELETQDV